MYCKRMKRELKKMNKQKERKKENKVEIIIKYKTIETSKLDENKNKQNQKRK